MALNDVVYNKTVDVAQSMPIPVVFAKQNENGKRKVIVKLMRDGQPFIIGTGVGGYIQGATAPNPTTQRSTKFKRTLTNIDTTTNTASFYIAQSMTAEIGITQCEVALYDSTKPDEIICTSNINIEVQGTGMSPQDEMASDDYQAIVSIKTEVTAMRDEVRTKTAEAIAAQGAAEQSEIKAKASEKAAQESEAAAEASKTAAAASETAAEISATNSNASEEKAKASETNAKASETVAKQSETNAKASETAAKESETAAERSAEAAKQSELNAKASEEAAKDSEVRAEASAETAAQNAYNSALNVQKIVAGNEAYTKQEADLKYSVAPRKAQTSTTGELKLTDADDGLAYLSLEGNSEQYTNTASANLFDAEYNKSLGLDATDKYLMTTGEIDISVGWSYSYYIKVVPNTLYSFVGIPASPAASFVFYTKDKTYISGISTKDAVIEGIMAVTTPNNCEWMRISYGYNNQIAMYLGQPPSQSVVGAVDTPSPDYPSEVRSVGDIPKDVNGVEIRNILDIESAIAAPDSEWTVIENHIFALPIRVEKRRINGTLLESLTSPFIVGISKSNTQLATGDGFYLNKDKINGFDFSSESKVYFLVYTGTVEYQLSDVKEMLKNSVTKIMVTYAAEIDEYRPYIGENNGLVKLESSGINRADTGDGPISMASENSLEVNTWTPRKIVLTQKNKTASWAYVKLNVERGKTYTFYCKAKVEVIEGTQTDDATSIGFRQYPPSGVMHGEKNLLQDGQYKDIYNTTGVIPDDVPNMAFMIYLSAQAISNGNIKITIDDLMVVEGEKTLQEMQALKFQPYYQQITWIPLREPLRKIDDYADSVDKDGNVTVKVVTRHVKDLEIADTRPPYGVNNDVIFTMAYVKGGYGEGGLGSYPNNDFADFVSLCNQFKMLRAGTLGSEEGFVAVRLGAQPHYIMIRYKYSRIGKTSADENTVIKEAITQWVQENDPVLYLTLQPTSQFIDLYKYKIPAVYIETYEPTTNIRCMNEVKPSTMGLDYKLAISSLIKRLEALETTAVQEVTRNV